MNTGGLTLNFWNANGLASPTQSGGGSGTWSTTSSVWTDSVGSITGAMSPQPGFSVFGGAPGTVTIDNTPGQTSALGMQFEVGGYILDGAALELNNGVNPADILVSNSSSNMATINSILMGTSGIDKKGIGTLVLNGANTYTGTTFLSAETLSISNNNNLGTATLTDNQAGNTNYAGSLLGSNLFVKQGTGSLILTGNSSAFTGNTQVNTGILQVNGTLGGNLLINAGGRPIARNSVVIDVGMDALLPNKALTLTLTYSGQIASQVQDHGVRGVIAWRFS